MDTNLVLAFASSGNNIQYGYKRLSLSFSTKPHSDETRGDSNYMLFISSRPLHFLLSLSTRTRGDERGNQITLFAYFLPRLPLHSFCFSTITDNLADSD
jgi:hypothetical protein